MIHELLVISKLKRKRLPITSER